MLLVHWADKKLQFIQNVNGDIVSYTTKTAKKSMYITCAVVPALC